MKASKEGQVNVPEIIAGTNLLRSLSNDDGFSHI